MFSPTATEAVSFLSAPTNPQGLKDLSADHVPPPVLLSQVILQNSEQAALSKTQVQLSQIWKHF